jgi:acyl carrier protein
MFRVDASVPFNELGLDSLDLVELMVATEKSFHIELSDEEHARVKTVDDIVTLLHQHPNAY